MRASKRFGCLLLLLCGTALAASHVAVDAQKSVLTIRAFKTGLFSAFAHDHEISAPIVEGRFSEDSLFVEISVDSRKLRVMDKDISDSDREKIQKTMLSADVLDSEKFPEIRFRSSSADRTGDGVWTVKGDLLLHGEIRPVIVSVRKLNGHYRGSAEIKQKEFGITPISIAGGSVKVKNEVRIEFDIVGQ